MNRTVVMTPRAGESKVRQASVTSAVAWSPGGEIDVRDWVGVGVRLGGVTRCSQWWIGDWVRYGTGCWGKKYRESSKVTGYDVQSLRNMAYVAGRFDISRRRHRLTWSHHAEVSSLDLEKQDGWLDLAEAERMSVTDLRLELRSARAKKAKGESTSDSPKSPPRDQNVTCPHCCEEFTLPLPDEGG
jgi:hypothetical protein